MNVASCIFETRAKQQFFNIIFVFSTHEIAIKDLLHQCYFLTVDQCNYVYSYTTRLAEWPNENHPQFCNSLASWSLRLNVRSLSLTFAYGR